ncbi:MAG: flagellar biosynthesis anti-sigma factor FlgM [Firmicutes bacterium]|jgi:flagellar biosynthesis anti-sigma factor FlgM|nr:flagellar biosynthesis anti-sigma factor FlgM [Bacillota bacterium]
MVKISDEGMQRIINRYIQHQGEAARLRGSNRSIDNTKDVEERVAFDKVTLSEQALELRHAFKELGKLIDAREKKVESIRKDLGSGTYKVTGEMIVKKLFDPEP